MNYNTLSEKTDILYCSIKCAKKEEPNTSESEFVEYKHEEYENKNAYDRELLNLMLQDCSSFVCGTIDKENMPSVIGGEIGNPWGTLCPVCEEVFLDSKYEAIR